MPELDRFETRLASGIHTFSDRAETAVDAIAVAERSIHRPRGGALGWLDRPISISAPVVVIGALIVALLGVGIGSTVRWNAAAPVPIATPSPSPSPSDPPRETEYSGSLQPAPGSPCATSGPGAAGCTGSVSTVVVTASDPRLAGTGSWQYATAGQGGAVAAVTGQLRIDAARGSWSGACTGAAWQGAASGGVAVDQMTCWLEGAGDLEGFTAFLAMTRDPAAGATYQVRGIVYPGFAPTP